jgi:hypothetical protein
MVRITRVMGITAAVAAIGLASACSSSPSGFTSTGTATGGAAAAGNAGPSSTTATLPPTKLFDTDFKSVCQGATQSRATAYDKAAPTHKVVYLETFEDSLVEDTFKLPDDWQVKFDPAGDAYAAVDLVACSVRTADTFVKDCDGYQKDNQPTSDIAKLHTATYKLTVHEATTGKELGSKELSANDTDCPSFVTFDSDSSTKDYYDTPSTDEVVAFVKPFAQP